MYGPLIALVVVLALGLLSRWVMAPSGAQRARREQARARRDFGLLVPVVTVRQRAEAERLQRLLAAAGIRGTVAPEPPGPTLVSASGQVRHQPGGGHSVLVFATQESRARAVLADDLGDTG